MLTRIIILTSVTVWLGIGVLWHYGVNDSLLFDAVICAAGMLAVHHAIRAERHLWAWGLLGLALFYNPILPLIRQEGKLAVLLVLVSVALFAICSTTFRAQRHLSMPSIIHGNLAVQSL
jgi:hypothetical protein